MRDRAWVSERISAMARTPLMFAYTRESFLMQLWLLLEFVDVPIETIRRDLAIKCFGNTMQGCDQPLDEEMAAKMIEAARRCF